MIVYYVQINRETWVVVLDERGRELYRKVLQERKIA